jgi:hypothetical protein
MKTYFLLLTLILASLNALPQENERSWRLNGHLQALETVWVPADSSRWQTMTSLNNRLDFRWDPAKQLSFHAGARNVFNYGQIIQSGYPDLAELTAVDEGLVDMTWLWLNENSYFFYTNIDRLNVRLKTGKLETTIGRQRINWGINLVWTPNDIFNAFNYFDFDYVERPGCDAILMQYYTSNTSSLQVGFKADQHLYILDSAYKYTYSLMYRFNRWGYDFQVLGGVMREDAVVGAGWSGSIKGAGFNGEASYFLDKKELFDTNGALVASAELNYTLKNSLFLHAGYLYNSAGTTGPAGWGTALFLVVDISAKNFTRARHSLFAEASYPVTPLIKGSLAGIFNPNDKSGFAGPSIDISLTDNLTLYMIGQIFWGDHLTEFGDYGTRVFWRLKWNF